MSDPLEDLLKENIPESIFLCNKYKGTKHNI